MRFSLILLFLLSLSTIQAQQKNDQITTSDDYLQVTRYRLDPEDLDIESEVDT